MSLIITTFFCRFPAAKFVNEADLNDALCEFDAVIEDFTSPVEKRHFRYDEHLKTVKRRSSASVSDSGFSDSESKSAPGGAHFTSYVTKTVSMFLFGLCNDKQVALL